MTIIEMLIAKGSDGVQGNIGTLPVNQYPLNIISDSDVPKKLISTIKESHKISPAKEYKIFKTDHPYYGIEFTVWKQSNGYTLFGNFDAQGNNKILNK